MSAFKGTPGPWSVTHDAERGLRDEVAVCYGAGRDGALYVVAERSAFDTPDFRAMREANARLIAAAPELLDALDLLLHDRTPWTVSCARAAIAEATGEQP